MEIQKLPIDEIIPELLRELERSSCVVLHAAPGSGKTTRVPPALLSAKFRAGQGEILVLEPRRLAAKMAARRVADERGEPVGETIGYQFRFENVSSPRTRVRFLTEGMLMRRLLGDPELRGVAAVVLDEFHERHLHGDVALGFLRALQRGPRPELKLVVMSATLDTDAVSKFLGNCPVLKVDTRMYDVAVEYLAQAPEPRGLDRAVRDAVLAEARSRRSGGDFLVFLPGMADIRRAAEALGPAAAAEGLLILPLHGELGREEQDRAVGRADRTKVILSTNVAETSLTIPGVTTVVDSGLARVASYSWWSGLPALRTKAISKASAIQRAGRAGRTGPGRCIRLYTKGDYDGRAVFELPEIARADLSQTVLELKALGCDDLEAFGWFEAPAVKSLLAAEGLLYRLGAVDGAGRISALGRRLVEIPAHPRLGRLLLEAEKKGRAREGATLAAMLSEARLEGADLFESFRRFRGDEAVAKMRDRLLQAADKTARAAGSGVKPAAGAKSAVPVAKPGDAAALEDILGFALLCGYPDRVARKRVLGSQVTRPGPAGRAATAELIFAGGGSALLEDAALAASSEYFVAVDVEEKKAHGQARAQVVVRSVSAIPPEWLFDLEPEGVRETDELTWDPARERVEAVARISYDQLVLSESKGAPRDALAAARKLVTMALGGESVSVPLLENPALARFCDVDALKAFLLRLNWARENLPGAGLPCLDEAAIRARWAELCAGKYSLAELRESEPVAYLEAALSAEQRRLFERAAPAQIQLPRGRRVKVHYEAGKPPWTESRLQDFFGMAEGPKLLDGKAPLTLHLLAPNQRAVQVTSDLAGFWKRVYPELRRELGRRYPRHAWPEDPMKPG